MEAAVVESLQPLLAPAFVERVVRKVMTRAVPVGAEVEQARVSISGQLVEVRRELDNLVEGLARTGSSARVTAAIRQREAYQTHLERELGALDQREQVSHIELHRLEKLAREKVEQWRVVLGKRVPQTRQVLSKLLRDRLVFVPEKRNGQMGYRFHGEGTILRLLSGTVPELAFAGSTGVPNGFSTAVRKRVHGVLRLAA